MTRSVAVIGAGYVGLVTAACFARLGLRVTCVEADPAKVDCLNRGRLPINEPGLQELWRESFAAGRLRVISDVADFGDPEFVFVAVGTPPTENGSPDMTQVLSASRSISQRYEGSDAPLVVLKSTVPVGTAGVVASTLTDCCRSARVVSNPEFLREGHAVLDFLRPDRVIVGADDPSAGDEVARLYEPLRRPIVRCSSRTAEMIKYASNAFLCTKVSFINEVAGICEQAGVDVVDVGRALSLDTRIGAGYLEAGLGWGGSCLPKDIGALSWLGAQYRAHTPILESVSEVNAAQPVAVVAKLRAVLGPLRGRRIAVLGLTFKPNCDDFRESPSVKLVQHLQAEGADVRTHDPLAATALEGQLPPVQLWPDPYEMAAGCHAVVVATPWRSYLTLDLARLRSCMARPILFDARNAFEPDVVAAAGFTYLGMGRPSRFAQEPMPQPAANGARLRLASAAS